LAVVPAVGWAAMQTPAQANTVAAATMIMTESNVKNRLIKGLLRIAVTKVCNSCACERQESRPDANLSAHVDRWTHRIAAGVGVSKDAGGRDPKEP
jgi:hypothetical protein